jgi:hypothetical protein
VRRLGWLLDRSIPIGDYRIGLDPLLGLVPGVGDTLTATLAVVIIYDAARLGLPVNVLLRMLGNILIDTLLGSVPLLGDLFDFAWQANTRNLRLVERHYDPLRAERPSSRIGTAITVVAVIMVVGMLVLGFMLLRAVWQLVAGASVG